MQEEHTTQPSKAKLNREALVERTVAAIVSDHGVDEEAARKMVLIVLDNLTDHIVSVEASLEPIVITKTVEKTVEVHVRTYNVLVRKDCWAVREIEIEAASAEEAAARSNEIPYSDDRWSEPEYNEFDHYELEVRDPDGTVVWEVTS